MKKKFLVAGICGLSLFLAGCSGSIAAKSTEEQKPLVAVVAKGYASPFWATVKAGAEKAGEDLNVRVEFVGPDNESDISRQVDQLNQMLVKQPKALVFAALDSKAEVAALEQYRQAQIPVIAFDSGVQGSDIPITTVATDNKAAGASGAKYLAEVLNGKGEVAILCQSQTSISGTDRRDGFIEEMKKNYPEIKIIDIQYTDSDQAKAQQQADAIITAHPNLKAIFATDDDGAVATANVVKAKNQVGKINIVGFDSGRPQIQAIKDKIILGSITQRPYQMGYDSVQKAVEVIKNPNIKLPKFLNSGFYWYDADNLKSEEIRKSLYE